MKTIWKFPVDVSDRVALPMPRGAEILTIENQGGAVCIWALVDSEAILVTRKLAFRGTGHPADGLDSSQYVGSVLLNGGALVFHLFDLGEAGIR